MKYTNHLNIIVAVIGLIVIAQTLTRTFWNSTPEQKFSVEVPATRTKIQVQAPRAEAAGRKRSGTEAPRVGQANPPSLPAPTAPVPALSRPNRSSAGSPLQPAPNPGIIASTPGEVLAPSVATIPSNPAVGDPAQGEVTGRSARGRSPFGPRSSSRASGAPETRSVELPPPPPGANEPPKRRPDENAPPPPVRSSMPGQP